MPNSGSSVPAAASAKFGSNALAAKSSFGVKYFVGILFAFYAASLASSMAGMELFGTSITALALGMLIAKKLPFKKTGVEWALGIFFCVVAIGALLASGLPLKFRIDVVGQMRWILLLYALTMLFAEYSEWQRKFISVVVGFYALVALYSIFQSFTGDRFFGILDNVGPYQYAGHIFWRGRGFFSNTMSYSYCLGQCLALAFAFFISTRESLFSSRSAKYFCFFAVMGLSLVFTFTRGAWVAAGVAVLAMSFLYNWRVGLKALVAIAAVVAIASATSPSLRERLTTITQAPDQSVSQRYDLWRANWEMFKDHPWFGVGYGYNYYFTPEYNQKIFGHEAFVAQAHNNFLQVIAGCGLPGFLMWLWFCGYFLWLSARTFWQRRFERSWLGSFALGVFGAQIFFHIGGFTQSTFFDAKPTYILLCLWAVMLAGIEAEQVRVVAPVK